MMNHMGLEDRANEQKARELQERAELAKRYATLRRGIDALVQEFVSVANRRRLATQKLGGLLSSRGWFVLLYQMEQNLTFAYLAIDTYGGWRWRIDYTWRPGAYTKAESESLSPDGIDPSKWYMPLDRLLAELADGTLEQRFAQRLVNG